MDSITQAALGAVVGEIVLGRKLGRRAIAWGALFGTLPDLDAILLPFFDTAVDLAIHRGFTHSLLLIIGLPFLLAKPLARRWTKQKVSPHRAGWFVFLAWSTHVLIDCFTVYGTQLYWPFSAYPVSFDNLFIIDPLFSLPLAVAVVWGLFIKPKEWKKGRGVRMSSICLGISCVYVGLSFLAKNAVSDAFEADLARRGMKWQRKMEGPTPFNILLWRGVVEREGEFWIGYRSIFDGDVPVQWTIVNKQPEALEPWSNTRDVLAIRRFSKNWCIARPTARGVWLVDLRFGEFREWDQRGLSLRPIFAWEFQSEGRGDKLKATSRKRGDTGPMMRRMWARIGGDQEDWSDKPRLIGNPAVLQEYLATVR